MPLRPRKARCVRTTCWSARRELAQELGYTGDPGDSAAMNMWLHKQVMRKLAENGGKVPDELRS